MARKATITAISRNIVEMFGKTVSARAVVLNVLTAIDVYFRYKDNEKAHNRDYATKMLSRSNQYVYAGWRAEIVLDDEEVSIKRGDQIYIIPSDWRNLV